jgi:hypothetical protein
MLAGEAGWAAQGWAAQGWAAQGGPHRTRTCDPLRVILLAVARSSKASRVGVRDALAHQLRADACVTDLRAERNQHQERQ